MLIQLAASVTTQSGVAWLYTLCFMATGSYLTALIKAKQARLKRSSLRSILLALDIEDGCRQ